MDIGEKIRKHGVRKLAARTGLSPSHISLVFSGGRNPSVKVALVVADALGVNVADLLCYFEAQRRRRRRTPRPEAA